MKRKHKKGLNFEHALALAVRWLSYRAHTAKEIEQKLTRVGAETLTAASVVAHLQEKGYLEDGVWATQWLQAHRARGWGRHRLFAGLVAKGIPGEKAEELLRVHLPEAHEAEEAVQLARRLRQRGKSWPAVISRLRGRGYSTQALEAVRQELEAGALHAGASPLSSLSAPASGEGPEHAGGQAPGESEATGGPEAWDGHQP